MPACKHTHTHLRVELYVYIYIYIYIHTHTPISVYLYLHLHTHVYGCLCACTESRPPCAYTANDSHAIATHIYLHICPCVYICVGGGSHVCIACTTTTIQKPEETGMYTIMPRYIHKDVLQIQRSSFRANVFKRERARNVIVMLTPPFSDG